MCGDQMPPTGLGQQRSHRFEIPPVEFNFSRSKDRVILLCVLEIYPSMFKHSVFYTKQDYSNYNYLDIMVKASISLDVSATNIVMKNPETQVIALLF